MKKVLNFATLIEILEKNQINFIGIVITPWHVLGLESSILMLTEMGEQINPLFLILPHEETGFAIKEEDLNEFSYYFQDHIPHLRGFPEKMIQLIKSQWVYNRKSKLYFFSAMSYRVEEAIFISRLLRRKIAFGKVDEGVSTYMLAPSLFNNNWGIPKKRLITRSIYKRILSEHYNCNLFISRFFTLKPNKLILPYYKKVLGISEVGKKSKNVVIATMAFSEDKVFNNEIIRILKIIVDIIKSNQFNCIIKPHPREVNAKEKYSCLNCYVEDNSMAMESLLVNIRPSIIISFSSTCLITSKLFYNIFPISVINLTDLNNYGDIYQKEMVAFRKTFGNQISIPNSLEEFDLDLKKSINIV